VRRAVCGEDDLPAGGRRGFVVDGRRIVVVRAGDGALYALADNCPHEGARLSEGHLGGVLVPSGEGGWRLERRGEVLRCPWHNFGFDVHTGCSLLEPERDRVKTYPVAVEDGRIVIEL
jgi:nitrite reductase (NADH) small subunit